VNAALSPWDDAAPPLDEEAWQTAYEIPALHPGGVHLWRAVLRPPEVEDCTPLEPAEWSRAGRLHFQRDRDRFLATRLFLRKVLGAYLNEAPSALRFVTGPHGKPRLAGPLHRLRFNLSHSDDLLLLAVTEDREVGVDIELMRPDIPFGDLAAHYFQTAEAREVELLPPERQANRFYEIWTATEARLKAIGEGLGGELPPEGAGGWSWRNFAAAPRFAGAVAVEGDEFGLAGWLWPE
jgi:4'-phosphopantetheinyl transferase